MRGRRIGAWTGWLLAAALLYFFENNTGTRAVLVISLLVPLLSMGCAYLTARRMTVGLAAPETADQGERIRCRLEVRAPLWRAGCAAACVLAGRNGLTGECFEREIGIPFRGTAEAEAVSSRCGCLELAAVRTEARDWFGLARFAGKAGAKASVIIRPALYPVEILREAEAGDGAREDGENHRRAEDPEPGDLRPYRPGDPLRRIHWKLSEKMNETLIRESAPEALDPAVLLLETAGAGMPDPEAADAAARALLSVSRAMAEAGIAHAVITSGNGGPAVTAVMGEDGFRQAAEQVLTAESRAGGERAAMLLRQADPDGRFRRGILFSAYPETGTLPAGIRAVSPDPADARVEI